jgi:hypothetical protein
MHPSRERKVLDATLKAFAKRAVPDDREVRAGELRGLRERVKEMNVPFLLGQPRYHPGNGPIQRNPERPAHLVALDCRLNLRPVDRVVNHLDF